jgi:hypothetical protein
MIAASIYLPSAISSMIAASSIHGTEAQNLVKALRNGCMAVSGIAFEPDFCNRVRASSLVRPVECGTSLTEEEEAIIQMSLCQKLSDGFQFLLAFCAHLRICHL